MTLRMVAALAALVAVVSCASGGSGKGLIPPPNPAQFSASAYQPERAYAVQPDGALARPVFRTDGTAPYRAEIRDVLVAPGKATVLTQDGIAVVDTREGTGVATLQDRPLDLAPGVTFGLSQGQTARLQNNGKTPLVVRIYVVTVP